MTDPLLQVDGLTVSIERTSGWWPAVDDLSLSLPPGGALGIVGESGSGKSLTLRALMGLLPSGARLDAGTVALAGTPLPQSGRRARLARRGRIAIVLQDPLAALNPVQTVAAQIAEVPRVVFGMSRRRALARAVELLTLVGIPDATARAHSFPHQLSGGMRQRVAIAIAIAAEPQVLLCDEPTTALDVTVQAQVLDLLANLRTCLGLAVVFVSHDLAVVRQLCDEIAVMYAGRVVEGGPTGTVLDRPAHAYTLGLRQAVVELDDALERLRPIPGALPDVDMIPSGCPFNPRCAFTTAACLAQRPPLEPIAASPAHATACINHELLLARAS